MTTTRDEVISILLAVKLAVEFGRCQFVLRSSRNIDQDLIDLNLTRKQAYDLMTRMTPASYVRGPEHDDLDPSKDVWIFGVHMDGKEIYIKLRVIEFRNEFPRCAVWSFHEADHRMSYPYKGPDR